MPLSIDQLDGLNRLYQQAQADGKQQVADYVEAHIKQRLDEEEHEMQQDHWNRQLWKALMVGSLAALKHVSHKAEGFRRLLNSPITELKDLPSGMVQWLQQYRESAEKFPKEQLPKAVKIAAPGGLSDKLRAANTSP